MSGYSVNGITAIRNDSKGTSFQADLDHYQALIIGDVCPEKVPVLELDLGCPENGLWFRC